MKLGVRSPRGVPLKLAVLLASLVWLAATPRVDAQPREPFVTPLTLEEMSGRQAVFETDLGPITIDPASASTSFFIVTGTAPELDGEYTACGVVVAGLDVVGAIEAEPTDGEAPVNRVEIIDAGVVRR